MSKWLHDYAELAWRGLSEWEILQSGSLGPLWSGCLLHILLTASINPKSAGNFTSKNNKWKWSNLAVSTSLNFYWVLLIIIWLWVNFYHLQCGMKKNIPWCFRIQQNHLQVQRVRRSLWNKIGQHSCEHKEETFHSLRTIDLDPLLASVVQIVDLWRQLEGH